jgi:hypothetical protein
VILFNERQFFKVIAPYHLHGFAFCSSTSLIGYFVNSRGYGLNFDGCCHTQIVWPFLS